MKDFFISYDHTDRDWAEWVAWQLEESGYSTQLQEWDFQPGSNFALEMAEAIASAEQIIAIVSTAYLSSFYHRAEWATAFSEVPAFAGQRLLPIRVQECEPKGLLSRIVYLDLVDLDESTARKALLQAVRSVKQKPSSVPEFLGVSSPRSVLQRPAHPAALPAIWNIPQRNPNFTGRKIELSKIERSLSSIRAPIVALTGLGGIGKSILAIEYSYRHASEYNMAWWIRAYSPQDLKADFASLAKVLKICEDDTIEQDKIHQAQRWLKENEKWLIVFDGVMDPKDVAPYLSLASNGHTLITSRYRSWEAIGDVIAVESLTRSEAVDYLLARTGQKDQEAAAALAQELGGIPLALDLASSHIETESIQLIDFLKHIQNRAVVNSAHTHANTIVDALNSTFDLTISKAGDDSKTCIALLNLCSFLESQDIPKTLLLGMGRYLPTKSLETSLEEVMINQAISVLAEYSLIVLTDDALSVHRLIQERVRDRLQQSEQVMWCEAALRIVGNAFLFNSNDVNTWSASSRLLPHALAVSKHAERLHVSPDSNIHLLNQAALYLRERAQFAEAKVLCERALVIAEEDARSDRPEVAKYVNNLGLILQDLGDLAGARKHFEHALAIAVKAYGPEHPSVATFINNLGSVLQAMGDFAGARKHYERALEIDEKAFGPEHPSVATRANNLGLILQDMGDLAGAREHFERALSIDEKAYGSEHPEVATDVNNLGRVLRAMGDLTGARMSFERALLIDEKAYGPDHPSVATRINNLGSILRVLGDFTGARKHFERALAISEQSLGPDHPTIATLITNLGSVLQSMGNLAEARAHYERALNILEKSFLPTHSAVVEIRAKLNEVRECLS